MTHRSLQVFVDDAGKFFISRDDHRRYCEGLLRLARVHGYDVEDVMKRALQGATPGGPDVEATAAYFGSDLPVVQEIIRPLLETFREMLPGFDVWMTVTGMGNDRDFILALINWQRVIVRMPKPRGTDRNKILQRIALALRRQHLPETIPIGA